MKIFFNSLGKGRRSIFLLYLIVMIPIMTMSYFLYLDYSYREEEEIKKNQQMAGVLADSLDSYLLNVKTTLINLSNLPPVVNQDEEEIREIFQHLALADKQVSLYWAIDTNGKIIAKYPSNRPDRDEKAFVDNLLRSNSAVSEPRKGAITGLEIITVYNVVKDNNGKVIGVVGASIPLEKLRQRLLLKVGNNGFPVLVTKSGKFLVHPELDKIRKKVAKDDPIFQAINKGGSGTLDIVAPFDKQRKFFSYVPLKQANWVVIVIQPLSEFHAQVVKVFSRNVVIIILVIFIVILAIHFLMLFRKRAEEARILQAEKLSVVGQLAAGMAHEIRNPLTTIRGFAQIATTSQDGLTSEYLDIIISEVDRIESIVKETLLLAKPTPLEFKSVCMEQLLDEVYALMSPETNLRDIAFTITIPKDLPTIKAEPNQLKQVFINLIKNAIEALPNKKGIIEISASYERNLITITTKDNGEGIPKEIQNKLGSPFVSTKENGTGLGLMVSYRIIQNHGGKISVDSSKKTGTQFIIQLPIRQQ